MPGRSTTTLFCGLAICLTAGWLRADDADARKLSAECDALIAQAVRRPFGIAWGEAPPADAKPNAPRLVRLDPPYTPSAALVLWLAGDQLNEPKYKDAAVQAARAISMAQEATGRVPTHVVLGQNAIGRDQTKLVPDRAATTAALGLVLTLIDGNEKADPTAKRVALRASGWLQRQQSPTGAFFANFPENAELKNTRRLIRLDSVDYRDPTLAMLYSYDVLEQAPLRIWTERAADQLIRLRFSESRSAKGLWYTAFDPDGGFSEALTDLPRGVDVLATRNGLQILLAVHLILGSEPAMKAIDDAVASISNLPREDGKWRRLYMVTRNEIVNLPTTAPATVPSPFAGREREEIARKLDTFGLDATLAQIQRTKDLGRFKYRDELAKTLTIHQRLAALLTGLCDDPFGKIEPPPVPNGDTVPDRVKRIWSLLLQAKAKQ